MELHRKDFVAIVTKIVYEDSTLEVYNSDKYMHDEATKKTKTKKKQ